MKPSQTRSRLTRQLAAILSLLIFAAPLSALASTQVVVGGNVSIQFSGFGYGLGGYGAATNVGNLMSAFPVAGTLSSLYVKVATVPGGVTTRTFTIRKNQVATALTCTIDSAQTTCNDLSNTITFAVGDTVDIFHTDTGTPANSAAGWSVVFTPTVANETVFFSSTANGGSSAYTFFPLGGGLQSVGSESLMSRVMPEAGVMDTLLATTTSIVEGSELLSIWQNAATSTLQCTIMAGSLHHCNDNVHTLTIAQGETISVGQASTSASGKLNFKGSANVRFVPTTAGNFDLLARVGNDSASAPIYGNLTQHDAGGTVVTVEATSSAPIAANTTFTSMTLSRTAAPGSGKFATTTLRVNGADSTLQCVLTGTGSGDGITTKTCTGSVAVVAGDLVNWKLDLTSGGTVGTTKIGLVGTNVVADPEEEANPARLMRVFKGMQIQIIHGRMQIHR